MIHTLIGVACVGLVGWAIFKFGQATQIVKTLERDPLDSPRATSRESENGARIASAPSRPRWPGAPV